jgi:hypothetical protein
MVIIDRDFNPVDIPRTPGLDQGLLWKNDVRNRNISNPDAEEEAYANIEADTVVDEFFKQYKDEPEFLERLKHKMVQRFYQEKKRDADEFDRKTDSLFGGLGYDGNSLL